MKNFRFAVATGFITLMGAWGVATLLRSPSTPVPANAATAPIGKRADVAGAGPSAKARIAPAASAVKPRNVAYVDPDTEAANFQAPSGRYADSLDRLITKARAGDPNSAYTLSRILLDCYQLEVNGNALSGYGSNEEGRCEGVHIDNLKDAAHWLQVAAEEGLVAAQTLYPAVAAKSMSPTDMIRDPAMIQEYKDRSMSYLARAAEKGSTSAMNQLSSAYANGVMASTDPILAYAYDYAATKLHGVAPDESRYQLTPEQREEANTFAEKLLSHCCE